MAGSKRIALKPMAVADFYAAFMAALRRLGIDVHIWTMPSEIENAIPFEKDRTHAQYDPVYVQKFWQAVVQADRVMTEFRARFLGKASPVHFFWGSFDLAVTRFSGRTAPPPKSATPERRELGDGGGLFARSLKLRLLARQWRLRPRRVLRLRLSGAGRLRRRAPQDRRRLSTTRMSGSSFCLTMPCVRPAIPTRCCLAFLQETYAAAADLAKWDRKALERGA